MWCSAHLFSHPKHEDEPMRDKNKSGAGYPSSGVVSFERAGQKWTCVYCQTFYLPALTLRQQWLSYPPPQPLFASPPCTSTRFPLSSHDSRRSLMSRLASCFLRRKHTANPMCVCVRSSLGVFASVWECVLLRSWRPIIHPIQVTPERPSERSERRRFVRNEHTPLLVATCAPHRSPQFPSRDVPVPCQLKSIPPSTLSLFVAPSLSLSRRPSPPPPGMLVLALDAGSVSGSALVCLRSCIDGSIGVFRWTTSSFRVSCWLVLR